jgi:hypothetical protein
MRSEIEHSREEKLEAENEVYKDEDSRDFGE